MKKLFLMAALGVAGFMSANNNGSNSFGTQNNQKQKSLGEENAFQKCSVFVTFYDSNNNAIGFDSWSSNQPTLEACKAWQDAKIKFLQDLGYKVTLD